MKFDSMKPGLSIILIGAALFVATLLYFRSGSQKVFPDYASMVHYDPHRKGGHLIPNLNTYFQGEKTGQAVRVITNNDGFRNDHEFDLKPPPGTFRILLLGDSYIDGMRTNQNKTIGYIMEKVLNQEIKNSKERYYRSVEIMISGHNNPANAWYYYQEHGYKFNPDLVMLGVTLGNDIVWHNYKAGVLPVEGPGGAIRLSLRDDLKVTASHTSDYYLPKDAYVDHPRLLIKILQSEFTIRSFLAARSYVFRYSIPPILEPLPSWMYHVYATDYSSSLGLFYQPMMPEIEKNLCDFEEVLSGLHQIVKANGSELLVVLFPVRIQVSQIDWDLLTSLYCLNKFKFDLYYPNRRINNFCNKNNIEMLDLYDEFIKHKEKHLYFGRGDMHFNEDGQELAAKTMADRVKFFVNRRSI